MPSMRAYLIALVSWVALGASAIGAAGTVGLVVDPGEPRSCATGWGLALVFTLVLTFGGAIVVAAMEALLWNQTAGRRRIRARLALLPVGCVGLVVVFALVAQLL
jgi:hypothetical protein